MPLPVRESRVLTLFILVRIDKGLEMKFFKEHGEFAPPPPRFCGTAGGNWQLERAGHRLSIVQSEETSLIRIHFQYRCRVVLIKTELLHVDPIPVGRLR